MRLAPMRVPVNILAPTTVPMAREAVAGEARAGPARRQWRLTAVSGADLLQLDSWAPESWAAGERGYAPRQPAVLELTVVAPGGYRKVTVLQSSGDSAFDQAACDQVRRLAVRVAEAGSTPDRTETTVYRHARIAATVEERRGP
jgi:TonB family protein